VPGIPAERCDDQVAQGFGRDIGIDQAERAEIVDQRGMGRFADAAQLQVRAGREIKDTVAMGRGGGGDARSLAGRQHPPRRTDAHQPAVARQHRAERAGAPAFDLWCDHAEHLWAGAVFMSSAFRASVLSRLCARRARNRLGKPPAGIFADRK
jgi:hypothetical protein